ncbi:MAG: HAD hydrolase family protein [Phycisphaerales bacterium]|nr:MAG: HAD hydrolase family protein [Phycisphaerales bacterium]UCF14493.1 MAG: HAD hydrolase family protein [Phycisphaerales bacterium]
MVDLTEIQLLVLDVDGVLTDGTLIINSDGSESKFFNTLDGHGIRMWRRAGLEVALISGRVSEPTQRRAAQLDIEHVFQDCHFKLPVVEELLGQLDLAPEKVAYVGDDLPDLPVIRYVGFGVAVANAVDEVKQYADYVTTRPGGKGAVREVVEHILKGTDKWKELMERYLS